MRFLNSPELRSQTRNRTIHVLDFLTFGNLVFAVMPRWFLGPSQCRGLNGGSRVNGQSRWESPPHALPYNTLGEAIKMADNLLEVSP